MQAISGFTERRDCGENREKELQGGGRRGKSVSSQGAFALAQPVKKTCYPMNSLKELIASMNLFEHRAISSFEVLIKSRNGTYALTMNDYASPYLEEGSKEWARVEAIIQTPFVGNAKPALAPRNWNGFQA